MKLIKRQQQFCSVQYNVYKYTFMHTQGIYGLASGLGSFEIVFFLRTTLSHAFQTNLWMNTNTTKIWNRSSYIWYKISYFDIIFHIKILRKLYTNVWMNEWIYIAKMLINKIFTKFLAFRVKLLRVLSRNLYVIHHS